MTMSLKDARSAVNSIKTLTDLQTVEKNAHLFEKHTSKKDAIAKGGNSISWFEKKVTMKFSSASDVKNLSKPRIEKLAGVMGVNKGQVRPKLQKFDAMVEDPYQLEVTDDVGMYGLGAILVLSLKQPDHWLYSTDEYPESRFKFLTAIPAPYVGRRIVNGNKQKLSNGWVIIVINAQKPVQAVTVYPVPAHWPHNTTDMLLTD